MSRKSEKHRGSRTHGRGKKGGRGAGLRGGKGNAGLHKHKHTHMVKFDPYHFGRYGFKRHPSLKNDKGTINVGNIQSDLPKYLASGLAVKEGKDIVIDLTQTEYAKLLGGGNISTPVTIKVHEATQKAMDKVTAAGGKVEVSFESDEDFEETKQSTDSEE